MYRYNNLLSVPELRAEPHRREPISPEHVFAGALIWRSPRISRSSPSRTSWPRGNWFFQDFPGNGHGKIRGFCTVVPPTGTRRMHKQKLGVADLPREIDPQKGQPDTAICSPSPGAVSERMLDVLRPRELGPRGHVVFTIFPISQERATGKIPKSADRRPSVGRSRRCLKMGGSSIAFRR
ncbi:hypothetical protein EVAR_40310_1 [Eumeta japonica]|uniref:Uncharacterized protein n=1 Tax=Eumeta variegata TaxID=151549 RepID=A0A4C1YDU1_EUMVA|nr:hypothetical protein EVAR_40310_1 [Eumeta japonica]